MKIALTNASLIDGTGAKLKENQTVILEDEKILQVGSDLPIDDDTKTLDLAGRTLMPGIIDTHVHFANALTGFMPYHPELRYGHVAAKTSWAMQRMLESGVTSAQDLGGLEGGYPDAEEEGTIISPRLRGNAVQFMMPTNGSTDFLPGVGGYTSGTGQQSPFPGIPTPHCDGPWDCRKKAREVLRSGADVLKIGSGGCLAMRNYSHFRPTFTREEIDVFVDEGRRQNVPVICHVVGGEGLCNAIHAGVNSIEHGQGLSSELLDVMAKKGTWWVPTFWVIKYHAINDPSEHERDTMKGYYDMTAKIFEKAIKAGVKIAMGSDAGLHDPDNNGAFLEMQYMSESGMSNLDVIKASTMDAASKVRSDEITGSIVVGKEADLLVVDGNPLDDIKILLDESKKSLVMKAGNAVGGTWIKKGNDALNFS